MKYFTLRCVVLVGIIGLTGCSLGEKQGINNKSTTSQVTNDVQVGDVNNTIGPTKVHTVVNSDTHDVTKISVNRP